MSKEEEEESAQLPRDEAEIISEAKTLVGSDAELADVTPENMKNTLRVYKAGNSGYVAYTVVISKNYGTVETETLIYVGNNGAIKNVKKLVWKTSDAIYGYVPPTEETVNAFYEKLVGKKASDIKAFENTDLVSNATNTSTGLKSAIIEGLDSVESMVNANNEDKTDYTARILGIVIISLSIISFAAYKIVPEIAKRRKNG
jgi:hypothetical protein